MRVSGIAVLGALCLTVSSQLAAQEVTKTVNPKASVEARALLGVLYDISGKYTLTGQHNFPNTASRNSEFFTRHLGKTPAVYSQDWGFAKEGDKDSALARPQVVEEVKRQHKLGSIITLCWHAVPPTADEPVPFRPGRPGATTTPPGELASVQGRLTDEQFKDILTPGTRLHQRWCQQVDVIAGFLKQLRDAHIPVLWRPYHEMNGDWFWWGGRSGENGTSALYRQLFDRLVKVHKLDNLVWVWSVDRPGDSATAFQGFYPGDKYVDVLSLDVYGQDFKQSNYDDLVALSKGKPLVLGEVGNPPTAEILDRQPRWASYVVWAGMVRSTPRKQQREILGDPRVISREDGAYWKAIAPLRRAAGLPLTLEETARSNEPAGRPDFSGRWLIDEDKSELGNMGAAFLPYTLKIVQKDAAVVIDKTFIGEYEDDRVTSETLNFDGSDSASEQMGFPKVSTAGWSEDGTALVVKSTVTFEGGGGSMRLASTERWTIRDGGRVLAIWQSSSSPRGERVLTAVFVRQ